jgi:hypothetical protein
VKKFLYRVAFPAIVLALVYHFGYSTGRTSGIQSLSVMPKVTSSPQTTVPSSIASPTLAPAVVETSEKLPATVKRIRQTPEGLAVESPPVQGLAARPLPANSSGKAVFRSPKVSGVQNESFGVVSQQSELQPLKSTSTSETLPLLAKPQTAPQDKDCGCDK